MSKNITRRGFVKGAVAGLVLMACSTPLGIKVVNAAGLKKPPEGFEPNAFLIIGPDGQITVVVPHTELGQGSSTGLSMIVADELDADWRKVDYRIAPAASRYNLPGSTVQLTGGSRSVRMRWMQLRQAGATARQMLVEAAAEAWKVDAAKCRTKGGRVLHPSGGKSMGYGELALLACSEKAPADIKLKKEAEFKLIGKDTLRLDIPDKVSGRTRFGVDLAMDSMVYAVLARPPAYGAKPTSKDEAAALAVKGVKKIVPLKQGIAVCADSPWSAIKGREALKAKWGPGARPTLDNKEIEKVLLGGLAQPGAKALQRGQATKALAGAAKKLEATYMLPYLAHAVPEPINCTALIKDGTCQVWVPTQFQTGAFGVAAKISGIAPEKVTVHTTLAGGGFGRRFDMDVIIETLSLAKVFAGRPVQVQWTRDDDLKNDVYRPGNCGRIRAGLDREGKLVAWEHKVVTSATMRRMFPMLIRGGVDRTAVEGIVDMPYAIDNLAVEYVEPDLPTPVGFFRSVGNSHNAFTVECFVDELARAAGRDPLEFRLSMLAEKPRDAAVLKLAAEKIGWGKPLAKNRGRGLARHTCYGSWAAHAAEVSHDPGKKAFKVERLVCVIDCGRVINPDSVKAQMQGAAVMGLSTAWLEEVAFKHGGVASSNFHDYPILRYDETPTIDVYIVDSNEAPGGAGEPGLPPVAPAVANAIAAITGKGLRRLPLARALSG